MVLGLDDSAICGQSGRETTIDGCRWIVAGVMAVMAPMAVMAQMAKMGFGPKLIDGR